MTFAEAWAQKSVCSTAANKSFSVIHFNIWIFSFCLFANNLFPGFFFLHCYEPLNNFVVFHSMFDLLLGSHAL